MNENNRINVKGNIIDIVIFICIIFILICSYIKLNETRLTMATSPSVLSEITISFPVDAQKFRPGDKIYFSEDGELFGTVKDVRIIYKTDYYIKEGKEQISSVVTDEIKEISVIAEVSLKNNTKGSFINGKEFIAPGKIIWLSNGGGKKFLAEIYSMNNIFVQNNSN